MSDNEIDFSFMQKVGHEIYDMLSNDDSMIDWFDNVVNYYNENQEYPEDTISKLEDYLSDKKKNIPMKLSDDFYLIISDEDNIDNILGNIFFGNLVEEEEETHEEEIKEEEEGEIFKVEEDFNENTAIDFASLSPEDYYENKITKTMNTLFLSHDIAYALLKKFQWNQEKIMKYWFSEQSEILSSLRITLGSDNVPDLISPLSIRNAGLGECPFCSDESNLLELYCGHKICKNCLVSDIIFQITQNKPPVCRQDIKDKICGAEIMESDVKNLVNDEMFKKYKKLILNKEIVLDPEVKECQNGDCDCIITPFNSLPCHVGRCHHCYSVTCLKCNRGSHAPLIDCNRIDEFTSQISEQMRQLEQDQEAWFKREERLQDYRRSHMNEVAELFSKQLKQIKDKQEKDIQQEKSRISEIDKELQQIQDEISSLVIQQDILVTQQKPVSEVEKITLNIQDLRKKYDQKAGFKQRLVRDMHVNDSERANEINTANKEANLFQEALRDRGMYQRKMYEYEMSMNTRAYQNVSITSNDDDLVSTMTKKCPKCKTPIERNEGCNHMTCQICGYQFCYVCEEPWSTHKDYFVCPKYKKNIVSTTRAGKSQCGIDFTDMNDKKFYPPPMTVEKRSDFMRWNNLYTQHRMQKEKYDALFTEYANKVDQPLDEGMKKLPLYKLCPRNRISLSFQESMNEKDSLIEAERLLNTVLFAQSLLVWGFPCLYYMMSDPRKAKLFEFKLLQMGESKDKLVEIIQNPNSTMGSDLILKFDVIKKQIDDVLLSAETF